MTLSCMDTEFLSCLLTRHATTVNSSLLTLLLLFQADDLGDFPNIKHELLTYSDVEIDALAKDRIKKDNHNMSKY